MMEDMKWALLSALLFSACANQAATLGPVALFELADDGVTLRPLEELRLPNRSELTIHPQWYIGALSGPAEGARTRIQVQIRTRRADGLEQRILLTGDNSDVAGRSERIARVAGTMRVHAPLTPRRFGPIRAYDTQSMELLVAQLSAQWLKEQAIQGQPIGVQGLRRSPPLNCLDSRRLAAAERAVKAAGGSLELAVAIPVLQPRSTGSTNRTRWIVAVEAEPLGTTEGTLSRVAKLLPSAPPGVPPLADARGRLILGLSAFAFRLVVGEHEPTRPREKTRPKRKQDERLKRPLKLSLGRG